MPWEGTTMGASLECSPQQQCLPVLLGLLNELTISNAHVTTRRSTPRIWECLPVAPIPPLPTTMFHLEMPTYHNVTLMSLFLGCMKNNFGNAWGLGHHRPLRLWNKSPTAYPWQQAYTETTITCHCHHHGMACSGNMEGIWESAWAPCPCLLNNNNNKSRLLPTHPIHPRAKLRFRSSNCQAQCSTPPTRHGGRAGVLQVFKGTTATMGTGPTTHCPIHHLSGHHPPKHNAQTPTMFPTKLRIRQMVRMWETCFRNNPVWME